MTPLVVYNASAGSGKTFTLATEYIKLLIENPQGYRNILAVTFTNKATEEMKMRILSQLYGIWKQLPDSVPYIKVVTEHLGISKELAAARAGEALANLMHNYSNFHVQTIDTFFQIILRNLARELELATNLRLALNDMQAETFAVDKLIASLDSSSIVLKWIINIIFTNIENDKNWNAIKDIKSFGYNIFNNAYRKESAALNDIISEKNFFDNYTKELNIVAAKAKQKMSEYAGLFEKSLADAGFTFNDLKSGMRGIAGYFRKLCSNDFSDKNCINKTLDKCLLSSQEWVTKTNPNRNEIIQLVETQLADILKSAENERAKLWKLYTSASVTLQYLSRLRLLNKIEKKMREINSDTNQFLLSDTQQLLHGMVNGSDTPFIFEKTGTRLEHIMIDEFQDTGSVQWQNFKILLEECMSGGNNINGKTIGNLIVGDVKQSIYRWRSGDWRLLNNIKGQFTSPEKQLTIRNLNTNYRSERNIVDFNNAFFSMAANNEYEKEKEINPDEAHELKDAYADVCQNVPDGKAANGIVEVSLLPRLAYQDNTLSETMSAVRRLLDSGANVNSIAILVRTKEHIPSIAEYFGSYGIKIVSDEAFRLGTSVAVCIIIDAVRYIYNNEDMLVKMRLIKNYQKYILKSSYTDTDLLFKKECSNDFLPCDYCNVIGELADMPLFDMVERIYKIFNIQELEDQSAYICTFYDCINKFIQEHPADIKGLLDEWDDNLCNKTIQSDDVNGIRILSIHKSKGLEFDSVIVPFCDWELEKRSKPVILWCKPSEEPFNRLPLVPVKYSGKLLETIYADEYRHEHMQNSVDNLNLLYVAFTRAAKNLFVIGKRDASNSRSTLIQECLPCLGDILPESIYNEDENGKITFSYGDIYICNEKKENASLNVFIQPQKPLDIKIETFDNITEFVQSNKSIDFINGNDDTDEQQQYIKIGNIMHYVFSCIKTKNDIDTVLRRLEFEGILNDSSLSVSQIRDMLDKRLSDERIAGWFAPHWKLFNECEILSLDKKTGALVKHRPDRVMTDGKKVIIVDFKFGRPKEEYHVQVRTYITLLRSMGYTDVQGFLWFVYTNKTEEVYI